MWTHAKGVLRADQSDERRLGKTIAVGQTINYAALLFSHLRHCKCATSVSLLNVVAEPEICST